MDNPPEVAGVEPLKANLMFVVCQQGAPQFGLNSKKRMGALTLLTPKALSEAMVIGTAGIAATPDMLGSGFGFPWNEASRLAPNKRTLAGQVAVHLNCA